MPDETELGGAEAPDVGLPEELPNFYRVGDDAPEDAEPIEDPEESPPNDEPDDIEAPAEPAPPTP